MRTELISEEPTIYKVINEEINGEIHQNLAKKLVAREELPELGNFLRRRGLKISFTSGAYDMIHVGHGRYLQVAKNLGDILLVGLNSDKSVKEYKGPHRPILGEQRRAEMLAYLNSVDYITLYDEVTADSLIRLIKPDAYLCVEGSWPDSTKLEDKPEVIAMAEHGGVVYLSPRQEPKLSTSAIEERIKRMGMEDALAEVAKIVNSRRIEIVPPQSL